MTVPPPDTVLTFDGTAGTGLNSLVWNVDVRSDGYGTGEVDYATNRFQNVQVDGTGRLTITANQETYLGTDGVSASYTSGHISTIGTVSPGAYTEAKFYGLPVGTGAWPTFRLRGAAQPDAGELDVDASGTDPNKLYFTLHGIGGTDGSQWSWGGYNGQSAAIFNTGASLSSFTGFIGIYFDANRVAFYVNRTKVYEVSKATLQAAQPTWRWPFDINPQAVQLDVAVGGTRGGATTTGPWPETLTVGPVCIWDGGDNWVSSSTLTQPQSPAITLVSPNGGVTAGGTTVAISGIGFTGAMQLLFGGVPATSFTINSDTSITAVAPPGSPGTVDVTVTATGGTSPVRSSDQFTYSRTSFTVTSVAPAGGPIGGGSSVIVQGTGFTGLTGVSFGATAAPSFTVSSDTQLTAVSPAHAAATVDVTATIGGTVGTGTVGSAFDIAPAGTLIGNIYVPTATVNAVDLKLYVKGSAGSANFLPLIYNASDATTPTTLLASGSQVTVGSGQAAGWVTSTLSNVTLTGGQPYWLGFQTDTGTLGTTTIGGVWDNAGSGFLVGNVYTAPGTATTVDVKVYVQGGATAYQFKPVIYNATSSTTPTTLVATGSTYTIAAGAAAGWATITMAVSLTAGNQYWIGFQTNSAGGGGFFAYTDAAGSLTNVFAPAATFGSPPSSWSGGGTEVAQYSVYVDFGAAAEYAYDSTQGTKIYAPAATFGFPPSSWPAGGATTTSLYSIYADFGVATPISSADIFAYVNQPAITSISPATGANGAKVIITGTDFTGVTSVTFGSNPTASFVVVSNQELIATAPSGTGTVDIRVTATGGTTATGSTDLFAYVSRLLLARPTLPAGSVSTTVLA